MASPTSPLLSGHCLCGNVRYRTTAGPLWVGYCNCPSCRRATGSVIAPYAGYRPQDVVFEGEAPARFASSPGVVRQFCRDCGTPISYQSTRWPDQIHLLLGSGDDLTGLKPEGHVYCDYQVPWFEVADDLPRSRTSGS